MERRRYWQSKEQQHEDRERERNQRWSGRPIVEEAHGRCTFLIGLERLAPPGCSGGVGRREDNPPVTFARIAEKLSKSNEVCPKSHRRGHIIRQSRPSRGPGTLSSPSRRVTPVRSRCSRI